MAGKFKWIIAVLSIAFIYACSGDNVGTKAIVQEDESCIAPTIIDPNNTKPMALMMRQMATNSDSIRQAILRGQRLDSLEFPFMRFFLVEPTDPSILEPQFYEHAASHQIVYQKLFEADDLHTAYNAMIESCITCHQNYCSGPIKKIKKLYIVQ
jgi:hypothetical protein